MLTVNMHHMLEDEDEYLRKNEKVSDRILEALAFWGPTNSELSEDEPMPASQPAMTENKAAPEDQLKPREDDEPICQKIQRYQRIQPCQRFKRCQKTHWIQRSNRHQMMLHDAQITVKKINNQLITLWECMIHSVNNIVYIHWQHNFVSIIKTIKIIMSLKYKSKKLIFVIFISSSLNWRPSRLYCSGRMRDREIANANVGIRIK